MLILYLTCNFIVEARFGVLTCFDGTVHICIIQSAHKLRSVPDQSEALSLDEAAESTASCNAAAI